MESIYAADLMARDSVDVDDADLVGLFWHLVGMSRSASNPASLAGLMGKALGYWVEIHSRRRRVSAAYCYLALPEALARSDDLLDWLAQGHPAPDYIEAKRDRIRRTLDESRRLMSEIDAGRASDCRRQRAELLDVVEEMSKHLLVMRQTLAREGG